MQDPAPPPLPRVSTLRNNCDQNIGGATNKQSSRTCARLHTKQAKSSFCMDLHRSESLNGIILILDSNVEKLKKSLTIQIHRDTTLPKEQKPCQLSRTMNFNAAEGTLQSTNTRSKNHICRRILRDASRRRHRICATQTRLRQKQQS